MCVYGVPCTRSLQVPRQSDGQHAVQDIWNTWTIKTNLPPLSSTQLSICLLSPPLSLSYSDTSAKQVWTPAAYQGLPAKSHIQQARSYMLTNRHTHTHIQARPATNKSTQIIARRSHCYTSIQSAIRTATHPSVHPSIPSGD